MNGHEWFMNVLFVIRSWSFVSYLVADALWYFRLLNCLITRMAMNDSWMFLCDPFMVIRVLFGGGCPLILQIAQLFDNMNGHEWFMNVLFVIRSWSFVSYYMVADALWYFRLLTCLITWMATNDSWMFYLWSIHGHSCLIWWRMPSDISDCSVVW